jgi:hypothetical protein
MLNFYNENFAGIDECDNAADVYQCGRDEAPAITSAVYTAAAGNATVVNMAAIVAFLDNTKILSTLRPYPALDFHGDNVVW